MFFLINIRTNSVILYLLKLVLIFKKLLMIVLQNMSG